MISIASVLISRYRLIAMAVSFLCFAGVGSGHSAYFSTPTSDVLPENQLNLEADLDARLSRFRDRGWQSFGFSSVYGVRKKMEIGLNVYFVRTIDGFEPADVQPNVKFQLHNTEDKGTSLAVGGIAYLPVRNGFSKDIVTSVYVAAAKKFKRGWTPKLTAGAYQLIGGRDFGDRLGFLLAVEQPVHSRLSLIADWNTGKNRLGYAAAGVGMTLTKRSYLYSAYYLGNEGAGNYSLGLYYGFTL